MKIKDTKERAELIWQLNRVGDYSTHKELWDAYYKFEELVKNCSIPDVVGQSEQLLDFIQWRKQVAVDDLTDKEIVEFYLARKIK